ncbi:flagellar biosynthesis protein [Albirhodobacter sp. R86504]|uniref:flagellar biosynthesis protein n=1 Tax=Albirhodobacter sp. R86504 TaxID=3093848 RepID=UPI0036720CD1
MSPLKLEEFAEPEAPSDQISFGPIEFEETKLASFEQGYAAGWEDATAAQDAETARLRGDLGRNMAELSATYETVRGHLLQAIHPLLHDMVAKVMPRIAQSSLPHIVMEHLIPLADASSGAPIQVICHPTNLPQVRDLLSTETSLPLQFVSEPTLGEGQVYLRMDQSEQHIDMDSVTKAIGEAIDTYFKVKPAELPHD